MQITHHSFHTKHRYIWRILLVDDDEDDYILVRQMLSDAREGKFVLEWVSTFNSAIETLESDRSFDAVVVDYDIGIHTGIEIIRDAVSSQYPAPILLLTGRATFEVDVEAMEAGAADYLNKNEINGVFLERAIRYAIERKRQEITQQENEAHIRESEERFRTLFNSMLNGFAVHEIITAADGKPVDYRFLSVNPAFEKLTGLKGPEIIGKTVREVLPGIDPIWIETYGKVALSGEAIQFENYATPLDRYYQVYAFCPQHGQFASVFSDISERVRTEISLRESEARFRSLFNNQHSVMLVIDPETAQIIDANPAACWFYGWSREELIQIKITDINQQPLAQTKNKMEEAKSSSSSVKFQAQHRLASGEIRDVSVHSGPIRFNDRQYLFSIIHDITEQRRAEKALEAGEARYRRFFDNLQETVTLFEAVRDERGAIIDWKFSDVNAIGLQVMGRSPGQVIGHLASEFFGPEELSRYSAVYSQALTTAKPSIHETAFKDKVFLVIVFRMDENTVASTGIDITEQKQIEETLRQEHDRAVWLGRLPEENPDPVARIAADGQVLYHNPAAASLPGWNCKNNEMVEGPLHTLIQLSLLEKRYVQQDVQLSGRFYSVSVIPILEDQYVNVYGRDVTERRETEEALREAEERFRIALSNTSIAVFLTDLDFRYIWFYSTAMGSMSDQFIGKRDDEIVLLGNVAELMQLKKRVLEERKALQAEVNLDTGGMNVILIASIEPFYDRSGELAGVIGSLFNITEQRRLELENIEQRTESEVQRLLSEYREKERQEIARDLHDGPVQDLSSLIFRIQYAMDSMQEPGIRVEFEQIRAKLKETVQELRGMINELRPPALIRFGVTKAIQLHIKDFREKYPDLEVELNIQPMEREIVLSEQVNLAIFRIYQEAINNIVRHAQATKIRVNFEQLGDQVQLKVRDNGKGFHQFTGLLDHPQSHHFGLVGMKERAEAIGGVLVVISKPGEGTEIQVKVPTIAAQG